MAHLYQCPVSAPTRPFTKVAFHLNPCPDICFSPPSRWCITSIMYPKFASQLHQGPISKPSRSQDVCLTSIQALAHIYPSYRILVSPSSMYCLASIQVPIFRSHLHSGADICVSHLTTSLDALLVSKYFQSHRHLGLEIWASPPSMSRLISIQALILASQVISSDVSTPSISRKLHLGSFQVTPQTHPGLKMWMSNASKSFLTYIQDPRFLSHLYPCTVSAPPRYQDSIKAPIHMPHLHLGGISPPSRARLTSIQISRITIQLYHSPISPYPGLKMCIHLNPGLILHPSRYRNFCFISTHAPRFTFLFVPVESHLNLGPDICISPASR